MTRVTTPDDEYSKRWLTDPSVFHTAINEAKIISKPRAPLSLQTWSVNSVQRLVQLQSNGRYRIKGLKEPKRGYDVLNVWRLSPALKVKQGKYCWRVMLPNGSAVVIEEGTKVMIDRSHYESGGEPTKYHRPDCQVFSLLVESKKNGRDKATREIILLATTETNFNTKQVLKCRKNGQFRLNVPFNAAALNFVSERDVRSEVTSQ